MMQSADEEELVPPITSADNDSSDQEERSCDHDNDVTAEGQCD